MDLPDYGHVYRHSENVDACEGKLSMLLGKPFSKIRCFSMILFDAQF